MANLVPQHVISNILLRFIREHYDVVDDLADENYLPTLEILRLFKTLTGEDWTPFMGFPLLMHDISTYTKVRAIAFSLNLVPKTDVARRHHNPESGDEPPNKKGKLNEGDASTSQK